MQMLVVLYLAGLLIFLWFNRVTKIENKIKLTTHNTNQEFSNLIHKDIRLAFVLLIIMIGVMVITICTFVYLIVEATRREMYLCGALINQMKATQQSQRKSMNKSLAFSSASHDIRASLGGISVSKRDQMLKNLQQMEACTRDLLGILNSILDAIKIEAGKMQLEEEKFGMEEVQENVVDLYHLVVMKKGVDVILDPYDGSVRKYHRVIGDRGRLKQILSNSLSNAVKFTSLGHVTVRAWARKSSLENDTLSSNGSDSMSCLFCFLFKIERAYDDSEVVNTIQRDPNCVNLSHGLVLGVLERFKHARKPTLRFFCCAGEKPGFKHDSTTYNAMMNILGKIRQFETMASLLEEMGEKDLLTMETFTICIKVFAAAKERKKAVGVLKLMKKYKFKVSTEAINCLLDALGRAKLGKEAQSLFEKLEHRFTPNLMTYTVLLNGWCRVKNLMEAGRIWNTMIEDGFKPHVVAHNTMLEGLLRCKKRSDAIKFFELMKSKELSKHGEMNEAITYLEEMLNAGCEPDAAVYTYLMTGFAKQNKMDMVYRLLKEMKEKSTAKIYKKMIQSGFQPSIHTYNMIMKSYFVAKDYEMGCAVWEEMKKKGCCPDENSYAVLIGGLIRQGRSNEACKYLEEMIDKGMKAPQLDYNKFTAAFSRFGRPDVLEELAQKMKFSGNFEVADRLVRWLR
ncbi:hypothetical protein CDL12_24335 [Handroanthus impetiginosus]|uniref:Histidine kinase domain-containing protein n=1 Tax=Handroanthus impetiginosus TaxID=429701 RepID=A0A2G9GCX3_9LAMI|nr:hypothetical protein CDL12_24335 [Handroanthus impetiginosus]